MTTNFKNKIRPADIIYEIYPASITKCSVKFFADIYYYLQRQTQQYSKYIVYTQQFSGFSRILTSLAQQSTEFLRIKKN